MYQTILFDMDGPIATIRLNRPEKLNAFGGPMRDEILSALETAVAKDEIRVLVITGEGRGFSAGADILELKQVRQSGDEHTFSGTLGKGHMITRRLRSLPKPVIAAVNGPCAGAGLGLALGCDIRIASDRATFGPTFLLIGLHPDWGASWFLPRLTGTARACELIFTGNMISAQEAEKIGLINRVVEHEQLMPSVYELAKGIAKNSPKVLGLAKESIYESLSSDLESAMIREAEVQAECFRSEDFLEGVTAFVEKRKAEFKGR